MQPRVKLSNNMDAKDGELKTAENIVMSADEELMAETPPEAVVTSVTDAPPPPKKRKWSAYLKFGVTSVLYALAALTVLLVLRETGSLFLDTWFETTIAFSALAGTHLSGATYFGRLKDNWEGLKAKWSREFKGTAIGVIAALAFGITFTILRTAGNFFVGGAAEIVVNVIAAIGAVIGTVGSMGGFANRLSRLETLDFSSFNNFFKSIYHIIFHSQSKEIWAGVILGLGTSLAVLLTGNAATIAVATVSSFLTGGLAIPAWIIGALFVVSFTGANVSAFDYGARALRYCSHLYKKIFDSSYQPDEAFRRDFHQTRGSALGVLLGLAIATIVVVSVGVFVTNPWLLAIPMALGVYFTCTGLMGGLCGRMGRIIGEFLENWNNKNEKLLSEPSNAASPQLTAQPEITAEIKSIPGAPLRLEVPATTTPIVELKIKARSQSVTDINELLLKNSKLPRRTSSPDISSPSSTAPQSPISEIPSVTEPASSPESPIKELTFERSDSGNDPVVALIESGSPKNKSSYEGFFGKDTISNSPVAIDEPSSPLLVPS